MLVGLAVSGAFEDARYRLRPPQDSGASLSASRSAVVPELRWSNSMGSSARAVGWRRASPVTLTKPDGDEQASFSGSRVESMMRPVVISRSGAQAVT